MFLKNITIIYIMPMLLCSCDNEILEDIPCSCGSEGGTIGDWEMGDSENISDKSSPKEFDIKIKDWENSDNKDIKF